MVGSARALPACPSGAREADTVRGPACDGMLSPQVSPSLPAPPPSTSLPSAPKIHHFVMDTYCVRLRALPSASSSAREADLVRGPACDSRSARETDSVRGPACDGMVLMSPSASKIHHHFVMGSGCACLARHGSARETDPLRGPACDANPLEMGSAHALPAYPSGAREADTVRGPARDGMRMR